MTAIEEDVINVGLHGIEVVEFDTDVPTKAKCLNIKSRFVEVYTALKAGEDVPKGIKVTVASHTASNFTRLFAVGKLPKGTTVTLMWDLDRDHICWGLGESPKKWVDNPDELDDS